VLRNFSGCAVPSYRFVNGPGQLSSRPRRGTELHAEALADMRQVVKPPCHGNVHDRVARLVGFQRLPAPSQGMLQNSSRPGTLLAAPPSNCCSRSSFPTRRLPSWHDINQSPSCPVRSVAVSTASILMPVNPPSATGGQGLCARRLQAANF